MKIKVKRKANAPAEGLWLYLGDFSRIYRFHPMLKGSHFIDGSDTCEVGSTRQCNFKDGSVLKEQIVEWEEGSHYKINIIESTMPFKSATAKIGVRTIGTNKSETYMEVNGVPKNRLMGPMMSLMFRYKVIPAILKGLEDLYHEEHPKAANFKVAF